MANELTIPQGFGQLATAFQNQQGADELGAGISAGYAVMGYRGKVWSVKFQGNEYPIMRNDPSDPGPKSSIEVIILKSAPVLSKIYYASGFVEGSTASPDCFSNNGVTPDISALQKQAPACANCPQNAWGSKITEQGKQAKACQDSKRVVIVPADDMANEFFGGPMLLRIPPASLKDLKAYGDLMQQYGFPYFAVKTRISFDAKDAYPHFVFTPIQPLNNEEAQMVVALREDPRTQRILESQEVQQQAQAPAAPPPPPNPFQNMQGQPAPQPAQAFQQPAQSPQMQPQPQPQPQVQQPVYQQPVYQQPVYQQPVQGQPVYQQPAPQPQQPPQGFAPQGQAQAAPKPPSKRGPKRTTPAPQPQMQPQQQAPQGAPQGFAPPQAQAPQPQPGQPPQGYPYPQPAPQPQMQPQMQPQQPFTQPGNPQPAQPDMTYQPGAPSGANGFDKQLDALFPKQ